MKPLFETILGFFIGCSMALFFVGLEPAIYSFIGLSIGYSLCYYRQKKEQYDS